MGRIVENLWDCPYCGSKGIRGRERVCPNCGRPRSESTKFYLPNEITYTKEPVSKNPDWFCPFCNSYNSDTVQICHNCGAPRDDAKNYFEILEERGETPDLKNPSSKSEADEKYEPSYFSSERDYYDESKLKTDKEVEESADTNDSLLRDRFDTENSSSPKKKSIFNKIKDGIFNKVHFNKWFLIIGAVILLAGTLTLIFIPKTKTLTVTETLWSRSIEIEENRIVEESDWSVPNDAIEVLRSGKEIHHYDHVIDHYETVTEQKSRQVFDGYDISYSYRDLGNGYSEEVEHKTPRYRTEYYTETHEEPVYKDVPVYKTKYYYTIWRYVYDHTEQTSGSSTVESQSEPVWPEYTLKDKQRTGKKTEVYSVKTVDKKDKRNDYQVDYELWNQFEPGNSYKVKISLGKIIEIID